jgi:hypothetical protein
MSTFDGGGEEPGYGQATNVKIEAALSAAEARCSQQSTPAKPTSSWDDSSESEESEDSDVVGTIHQGETPWFNVDKHGVVYETAMNETMDEFQGEESEWDLDCPLLFRPFMFIGRSRNVRVSPLRRAGQVQASRILPLGYGRSFPCPAPTPPQSLDGVARVRYP